MWKDSLTYICSLCAVINSDFFSFSALTLLVGWQEGHLACKKTGCVRLLVVTIWSFARLIVPVVTVILSSNKIQNGDVLVPANTHPPGKWPLTWRENQLRFQLMCLRCLEAFLCCIFWLCTCLRHYWKEARWTRVSISIWFCWNRRK